MSHNFKKALGQNFLKSDRFPKLMVETLGDIKGKTVIEVGPGDGRVTNILLDAGANLIAVEADYDLIPKLISRFSSKPNFHLIHNSILEINLEEILAKFELELPYSVIGSLPYNISKPIIRRFLTHEQKPQIMSVIVQEEVALDYVAKPPQSTFLANWASMYADVKKHRSIPASQFHPKPKVNGAILSFSNIQETPNAEIKKVLKAGFSSPRKTLRNNLSSLWDKEVLDTALGQAAISLKIRPAELTKNQWLQLTKLLSQ